jgi:hypothetical protein
MAAGDLLQAVPVAGRGAPMVGGDLLEVSPMAGEDQFEVR